MIEMDLIRNLARACTLLATPSNLKPKQLKIAHGYARRLGSMCDYLAINFGSQTGEEGLAGTIRAELSILIRILEAASKPARRGRPAIKGALTDEELLILAIYDSFPGSRPKAVRHLEAENLIKLKKNETIEARVLSLKRLKERFEPRQ